MIISSFFCFLTLLSLFGYSYIFKKFENKKSKIEIFNDDIFIGILLIIFFSLLINFFYPLKYFALPILLLGLVFFIIGKNKEVFKFKLKYYFYFLFLINYLSYYNGTNVDSPLYHLQTLNWMILNKINLGITNLNIRFGVNSSWHSFLALMSISVLKLNLKYYLSSIIFSVLCYSICFKKKYSTSDIFLFLSISFLLTFSLIHPFVNGPILNHLGNPEVDIVAMFLFIFCFYYFLKFSENNFRTNDEKINFFIIIVFLAVSTKISNLSLIFLLLIIILFNKNYKLISFSNILIVLTSILWLARSFLISGCLIFPIKKTCIETSWTDINQTDFISKVIQSYTRDTRLRDRWTDFDYTLNSNDWFVPWFNDYFLNTSILKISSFLVAFSLLALIFLSIFKSKKKDLAENSNINFSLYLYSIIFFVIAIYIWLKAPEIRFGTGFIISLPCFLLVLVCNKLKIHRYFKHNYSLSSIIFLFLLILFKHLESFELNHLYTINKGNKDYSFIKKIADVDGVEIFHSLNSQCGDFPKICVNKKKESYKINQKLTYRIFLSNSDK